MKSLLTSFLCASFLVLTVGCGKDNKSGGNNSYTNLYNTGLSNDSRAVLDRLTAWHQGVNEGTNVMMGLRTVYRTQLTYNTQPICVDKTFLGFPYKQCKFNYPPTKLNELSRRTELLSQDGRKISEKGNTALNEIFNGSQGTLVSALDVPGKVMISELTFLRSDGTVVTFFIDRGKHSILNPILKSETTSNIRTDVEITLIPYVN